MAKPKDLEATLRRLKVEVEDESIAINNLVNSLVNKYGKELHRVIETVREQLSESRQLSNEELEHIVMQVPVHMYFAVEGLEKLGIEGDNAKATRKDVFNRVYIDTAGTIEDKTKQAELDSVSQNYVEVAYQRAYRKLKEQIAKAELVYSGAKKVLDKRTNELFITKGDRFNS